MNFSAHLQETFNLPPEVISVCDKYYILYWQSRYVYSCLLRRPRIVRESISYEPIFLSGLTFETLGRYPETQVRLSFRRLKGKQSGNVLIAPINGPTE